MYRVNRPEVIELDDGPARFVSWDFLTNVYPDVIVIDRSKVKSRKVVADDPRTGRYRVYRSGVVSMVGLGDLAMSLVSDADGTILRSASGVRPCGYEWSRSWGLNTEHSGPRDQCDQLGDGVSRLARLFRTIESAAVYALYRHPDWFADVALLMINQSSLWKWVDGLPLITSEGSVDLRLPQVYRLPV